MPQRSEGLARGLSHGSSHAPRWSVVGGAMTMLCNAATLPVLYFFLDKSIFAGWATALACLNLWCFPEAARTLLVTSGHVGQIGEKANLRSRLLLVSCVSAVLTMLGQWLWLGGGSASESVWVYLAPEIVLSLGIPLRFVIAERRGELQSRGEWRRQAIVMGCLNLGMSMGLILTAWFSHHVGVIAMAYVTGLLVQALTLAHGRTGAISRAAPVSVRQAPKFLAALVLSLGPLIFTQGDKLILRHILDVSAFADYTFYTALAGQISILSALPCVPLVAWFQHSERDRPRLLETSQRWNLYLVLFSVVGLLAGIGILRELFPYTIFGKLSFSASGALIAIYGAFSLNGPSYFLLLGHGRFALVGSISLFLAIVSVIAVGILGFNYGLQGAIVGNAIFVLTVVLGIPASRLSPSASRGWRAGAWSAIALFGLMLFVLLR
jgi:O-antigen/teichoic acid export membrane protein